MDLTTLAGILTALVSGGLAGTTTYWLLAAIPAYVSWDNSKWKSIVAIIGAGLIGVLAWLLGGWLRFWVLPVGDAQTWLVALADVFIGAGAPSYATSQLWHTLIEKPSSKKAKLALAVRLAKVAETATCCRK